MNTFRTELLLKPTLAPINLKSKMLTLGSCFSNSIGDQFYKNKFSCLTNPFGSVYNPLSIHKLLLMALENKEPEKDTYIINEGLWKNHDFHSNFSAQSKLEVEEKIKATLQTTHHFLKTTEYIIITYGTAFVYEKLDTHTLVANCHKQPSKNFTNRLLSLDEITNSFQQVYHAIKAINPAIKFIITASPVRHTKDTLELNSVSKSILRVASDQLKEQFGVDYFPAYEIMMDDLRDYRFYEADMIHPNSQAIDYIWQKFSDQYFSKSTKDFIAQWKEIKAAMHHKAFNHTGESHQKFLHQTLSKLAALRTTVDVEQEIKEIEKLLVTTLSKR